MKPLELTNIQKDRLLEMARKLFPNQIVKKGTKWTEDWLICFNEDTEYGQELIEHSLSIPQPNDKNDATNIDIHWFEFCVLHLAKELHKLRIADKLDKDWKFDDETNMSTGILLSLDYWNKHPVDFLYEYYKTIKK